MALRKAPRTHITASATVAISVTHHQRLRPTGGQHAVVDLQHVRGGEASISRLMMSDSAHSAKKDDGRRNGPRELCEVWPPACAMVYSNSIEVQALPGTLPLTAAPARQ